MSLGGLREVALSQPDQVAIIHGEHRLTFAELDALVAATAANLADALKRSPLSPGSFVPVLVAHDIPSVVLIHAGFRAGAPMGVIDAALPEAEMAERLEALGRSGVAMVHDESCSSLLQPDSDVVLAAHEPGRMFDPVDFAPGTDLLALFTSGSSGRAKGIVHGPHFVMKVLVTIGDVLGSGPARGPIPSIGPFHWAGGLVAVYQLLNSRSIAILPIDGGDAGTMVEALRAAKVESAILTPSLALWLARNNSGPPLADLKSLALGGEPVTTTHLDELKELIEPSVAIETTWGASEMTDFIHSPVEVNEAWDGDIPIRIGEGTSIRLDPSDDDPPPVHGGTVGEIIIRGDVARRYLGQPELTELRFGVDPDGVRFWRSGDLAEQLSDGTLFLRGRMDDMVKINGKLVEPAESLALLRAYPGLRAVEVLPYTYASGRIVLVAHVAADDEVSPDAVRKFLMDRLPIHVIPGVLMRHEHLPLTNRGKVDRQTLQRMQPVAWLETEPHSPEVALEIFLLARLRDILETDSIGIDDDLWFLGLDSLGAVEFLASIADADLGEFAPSVLLEHRTVRVLARQLDVGICERGTDIVIFNPEADVYPFFCIPGAGSTAMSFHDLAGSFSSDRTFVVVEARGTHTNSPPDRTVIAMAGRILAAVDDLQPSGVVTLLGYSAGGFVAWETAQRLVDAGRDVRVVMIDAIFTPRSISLGLNIWQPPPPGTPRLRRFTRACRSRFAGLKDRWREFRPGPPQADVLRYRALTHIMTRAVRRYEPAPSRFPVLFLAAEKRSDFRPSADSSDLDRWRARADNMTIVSTAGDHLTMLDGPNAASVAAAITEWIASPAGLGDR